MEQIQTIELFIRDEDEDGVFAISLVENPAIMEDFVALSEDDPNKFMVELKTIDEERKVVVGFALIPDLEIPRVKDGKQFNITMSKDTVSKAAELYMKNLNLSNVTSEHEKPVKDCCVIESWIVEDKDNDKSNMYGLEPKGGEWVVMMSLSDSEYSKVKDGTYKGFSIEAIFQGFEALEMKEEVELESYNDYPQSAKNNAKKVLKWREEHGDEVKGMTRVGWTRANQISKGENITRATIAKMASFKRHEKNAEVSAENKATPWKDAGRVAWLGWGGSTGIEWAIKKLKSIDNKAELNEIINKLNSIINAD